MTGHADQRFGLFGSSGGLSGTIVDQFFMTAQAPPDLAIAVVGDRPRRIAYGGRIAQAAAEAHQLTDLDQQASDVILDAVRRVMARFHSFERADRLRLVAPRKGPDGVMLARYNDNDPDHNEGVFALFAADPSALHVLRPGYSLDMVERTRPAAGHPCDWQLTGCDDSPGVYRRAACDRYIILFATCFGCYTRLNPVDDSIGDGAQGQHGGE